MTINELLVEQQINKMQRLNDAWRAFEPEPRSAPDGGLRRSVASALVRLGVWLDRRAGETATAQLRRAH